MKKIYESILIALLLTGMATSHAQDQLENPGFEQWENIFESDADTIREPVEWSSLKTSDDQTLSDFAPVVCKRGSDAHSGEYSIELTNVSSFIVVNGVATNGRLHPDMNPELAYIFTDTVDNRWNTPFNTRPDSIAGWFKYTPQGKDTLQVKVNLHQGFGKQPDAEYTDNWIGVAEFRSPLNTDNEWIRFSAPFTYFSDSNPEYVMVVLNSGNEYTPAAGSVALFDDLEMIYNSPQTSMERLKNSEGFIFAVDYRYLVIQGMDHASFQTIKIHDLTGKLVWTGSVTADQVDISSAKLRKGIYLVNLAGRSKVFAQKIMLH
ncbi:MAG: T9SS type A sorting domain-containing protein [Bacteroidetes bacterium]|nr:T9SS type A sorting domain-containing protein [Bacteroidota bacterium]